MKRRLVAKVLDIFKAMPDLFHFYFQVIYDRTSCRDENPKTPMNLSLDLSDSSRGEI